jgi:hypothetical protein
VPGEQLRHGAVEEGVHLVEAVLVGGAVLAAGDDGARGRRCARRGPSGG